MFGTLVESQGVRVRRTGGTAVSLLVHSGIIAVAAVATATETRHEQHTTAPPRRLVYYQPVHSRDALPALPARSRPARAAAREPGLALPTTSPATPDLSRIPTALPRINAPLGDLLGRSRITADPVTPHPGGSGQFSLGRPYELATVEQPARLLNRVEPVYPRSLAGAGLEGRVVVRFVVDTAGRAEPGSIVVLESAHALFTEAAVGALARMRFAPARVGGAPVRMLVELPFAFALRR